MKNKAKIILILSSVFVASCAQKVAETPQTPIESNISSFSKGFLMEGEITQTRAPAIGYDDFGDYVFSDVEETNNYTTSIGFESTTRKGFRKYSTQEYEGETYGIEDYTYFEDDDGYAYKESLNYKNEMVRSYSINGGRSSFVYNGFYNFFEVLSPSDFTQSKDNGNRYDLDLGKAGIISNNLLYSLNSGFSTNVAEAYFTMKDGVFSSFSLVMDSYYYLDSSYGYLYRVDNKADFVLKEAGAYKIDAQESYAAKGYTALEKALKNLGSNYTMHVAMNVNDVANSSETTTYKDFYFTGKDIYVHSYDDESNSSPSPEEDFYLSAGEGDYLYSYAYDEESEGFIQQAVTAFPSLYQGKSTYEDYLPVASEVSSDMFTYVKDGDYYEAESKAAETLKDCFYVKSAPFKTSASNSFSNVQIALSGESIAKVTLPFSYTDFQKATLMNGTYEITYSNIGTTVNPAL